MAKKENFQALVLSLGEWRKTMDSNNIQRGKKLGNMFLFFLSLVGFAVPLLSFTKFQFSTGFACGLLFGALLGFATYMLLWDTLKTFPSKSKGFRWEVLIYGCMWSGFWGGLFLYFIDLARDFYPDDARTFAITLLITVCVSTISLMVLGQREEATV